MTISLGASVLKHDFWPGKKVFVTGNTGFKGGWLSLWLKERGAQVFGYSAPPPTSPSFFEQTNSQKLIPTVLGDVRDAEALASAFASHKPEIVFHLAAQSLVRRSLRDPAGTYSTNVDGTVRILEATRATPSVRVAVIVTSDKCYLNDGSGRPLVEEDPLGGKDPYSSSKACAELVTNAYRDSIFLASATRIASVRAGNVIGGGDWGQDRLIPDLMREGSRGRPALIRNPQSTRPWQYVLDCLNGYLTLAERLWDDDSLQGPWNFGPHPGRSIPVREIADTIEGLWPGYVRWEIDDRVHPPEAPALSLDPGKASRALGWRCHLEVREAVEWTVDWYRRVSQGDDARSVSLEQIWRFEETLVNQMVGP